MDVKLVVGLGNPGSSYALNRHNIGFLAVDEIASFFGFSAFKRKDDLLYTEMMFEGCKVILIKPLVYMNNSGVVVRKITNFYKLNSNDVIVIHDDLDLDFARIKTKVGGGTGGHNGLKSIDSYIGKEYHRIRVGIGRPDTREQVSDYVLSNFSLTETKELEFVIHEVVEIIKSYLHTNNDRGVSD